VAQKIQTLFIDDLDGSAAEGTVRFGLDGAQYEIDLNTKHAQELRDALARYAVLPGGSAALPGGRPAARAGERQAG
jgi:hypothetical protein